MGELISRLLLSAAIALPIYLAARVLYLRRSLKANTTNMPREVVLCLFTIFMAGLLLLVFQPGELYNSTINHENPGDWFSRLKTSGEAINFVPFYTIRRFFRAGYNIRFIINIVANILMFSPIGLCLPLLWTRWQKAWKVILLGCCFSTSIEFIQLFISRSVDIDDVILNTLGVSIGYLFYILLHKSTNKADALAV